MIQWWHKCSSLSAVFQQLMVADGLQVVIVLDYRSGIGEVYRCQG